MSKLEELIEQYCPDGVEYVKIGEIAQVGTGSSNGNEAIEDGIYPFFVRSQIIKKKDTYEYDEEAIIIPGEGGIGDIFHYINGKYALHQRVYRIHFISPHINVKFAFYYMKSAFKKFIMAKAVSSTVSSIRKPMIEGFSLPIPPLPVQEEIVRILDAFTELQAELQKRKQQYNYYLDNLLNFKNINKRGGYQAEVRWMKMSDTCLKICSGGTPSRKKAYYFKGGIPWLRTQEVDWNNIYDTEIKITAEAIKNSSARLIPENCVIIAMYGATAGKTGINKIPLTTNQACCNLQINPQIALYKFVYYWICKNYEKIKSLGQGSQNNINAQIVKDYPIPIPSLVEQQRIVSILDRFDTLTNDLTAGLPAEIEKRRQQYEYYRDKLLTFKRKGA